jgi:hypothetical protein
MWPRETTAHSGNIEAILRSPTAKPMSSGFAAEHRRVCGSKKHEVFGRLLVNTFTNSCATVREPDCLRPITDAGAMSSASVVCDSGVICTNECRAGKGYSGTSRRRVTDWPTGYHTALDTISSFRSLPGEYRKDYR